MTKILVADDSLEGRNLLTRILTSAGHNVVPCENGLEALNKFNIHKPDLVITDVKMPVMDGFELAATIRKDSSAAHVPIIFISAAYKDISSKTRAIDTGGNEYLTLPVDRQDLLNKVKAMLRSKTLFDKMLKSKEASKESAIKYRELFNHAAEAIYLIHPETHRIIDCNPKANEMTGFAKKQIRSLSFADLFPDNEQMVAEKIFNKIINMGSLSNISGIHLLTSKGRQVPVEMNATTIMQGDRKFILSYVRDITRQKKTEDSLHRDKNNFANILDSIEDAMYIVNDRYDLQYISPTFKKHLGPSAGRKCYEYFYDRKNICPECKSSAVFKGNTVRWDWISENDRCYRIIDKPLKNPDGSLSKLTIFNEITDLQKIEKLIRNKNRIIPETGGSMDSRQNERFSPSRTLWIEIDGSTKGFIKNISSGGVCFQSDSGLITDHIHEVKLLSDENMQKAILCRAIWTSKVPPGALSSSERPYLNGLKFISLNEKIRGLLNTYIDNFIK